VSGFVLHLREQDGLAAQGRGTSDPVAFGLHADDLRVRMLRDLAHQGASVRLGHPVTRLDPVVACEGLLEARKQRDLCRHLASLANTSYLPSDRSVIV
jgi:hypothetical protein